MGEYFMCIYREKVKRTWKIAFFAAILAGLFVHMYKFTNFIPNHDSLYNFYADQNMIASGRWFLMVSCALSSFFDLPWLTGVFSLINIGLTAVLLVEIFEMENPFLIFLTGCLLTVFPAVTDTMTFSFTADGYMLAMALAAFSVYVFRIEHLASKIRPVISMLCICLACAIYQAYVSFALIIAVFYLMTVLLDNRSDLRQIFTWMRKMIVASIGAMVLYYVVWKLTMKLQMVDPVSYRGIDQVGSISLHTLLNAIFLSVRTFLVFILDRNIVEHGITIYSVINILVVLAAICGICCAVINSKLMHRKVQLLLFVLCIASIPFVCCLWFFASPGVSYSPRMLQSCAVIYIWVCVVYDRWVKVKYRDVATVLILVFILNCSLMANTTYLLQERCCQRSYATAAEMASRIHMVDDGTAKDVLIIGTGQNWKQEDYIDEKKLGCLGPLRDSVNYSLMNEEYVAIPFLAQFTEFNLSYYSENGLELPLFDAVVGAPVSGGWELHFPAADEAVKRDILSSDVFAEMGIWPSADSVVQIGDTIVINLGNNGD